jgi:hypothetical protein
MTTHQVKLNGKVVAVGRNDFRLLTMVCSADQQDADGKKVTIHQLTVDGTDAFNKVATNFVPRTPLKNGDVIEILIGEVDDA